MFIYLVKCLQLFDYFSTIYLYVLHPTCYSTLKVTSTVIVTVPMVLTLFSGQLFNLECPCIRG